ncbi:hypothetical protein EVAR_56687_1 [Eumeta japonica]|uniref:Uncharacterized protein n=1 Tax=Eumeta variegata TaxID=151549 RepID=A0A4C2A1J3_EUMVA|nr:hypothetical protein EVAR_56687_1 [Eumeta japonica]
MASVTPYFLLLISVSFFKLISSNTVYHEGDQYEADPSYARATMTNATARAGDTQGILPRSSHDAELLRVNGKRFQCSETNHPLHLVGSVDKDVGIISRRVPDALAARAGASRRRTGAAARALRSTAAGVWWRAAPTRPYSAEILVLICEWVFEKIGASIERSTDAPRPQRSRLFDYSMWPPPRLRHTSGRGGRAPPKGKMRKFIKKIARLTLTLLSRSRTLSKSRGMSLKKTWSWKSALFAFTGIASSSTPWCIHHLISEDSPPLPLCQGLCFMFPKMCMKNQNKKRK